MKGRGTVQTSLSGIAKKAKTQVRYRFRNLYGMLNETFLRECWRQIRKDAASGIDGVSAFEYEQRLQENISDLVDRLKRKVYRARLVRRKYIPKGKGKWRPLGIPVIDDKLAQKGAAGILQAIYEQDFLRCSYGYRLGVGARDAVKRLTVKLQFGNYNYVVEVDIKGFFENIDHEWMIRMLEERIDDKAFLRLIRKWLKAGVLEEDGRSVVKPGAGTPQGGVVSPVMANVYLHYVLDLWFHRVIRKGCKGEACMIRYADDFVCAFEHKEEAERFLLELAPRLKKFNLKIAADKTRIIEFKRNDTKPRFDFLGFEFRWSRDRKGRPHLKRRTSRKKLRQSLMNFKEWLKEHRSLRIRELFRKLNSKLRGYFNYYGVIGNSRSLHEFYGQVVHMLQKWLSRRSQRGRVNWQRVKRMMERFDMVKPFINEQPFRRKSAYVCLY
jgi:RNA-directed DNA polymerase